MSLIKPGDPKSEKKQLKILEENINFETILAFWGYFGIVLALFWHHFGVVLRSFCGRFDRILGLLGVFLRSVCGCLVVYWDFQHKTEQNRVFGRTKKIMRKKSTRQGSLIKTWAFRAGPGRGPSGPGRAGRPKPALGPLWSHCKRGARQAVACGAPCIRRGSAVTPDFQWGMAASRRWRAVR